MTNIIGNQTKKSVLYVGSGLVGFILKNTYTNAQLLLLFVSLVIFEMSKKFDEEFPSERHSEAGIMRLIKKIFKASGIEGVVINSRVINI